VGEFGRKAHDLAPQNIDEKSWKVKTVPPNCRYILQILRRLLQKDSFTNDTIIIIAIISKGALCYKPEGRGFET
jgi:hypothetical protein